MKPVTASDDRPPSRRTVILTVACTGGTYSVRTLAQEREDGLEKTSATVVQALKTHAVPGAQICLVDPPRAMWNFAAGVADKSSGRAMTAATRFEAASLSKPVFACAVLRLCEQGKLSLDAQLGELLPARDLPDDQRFPKVSVRQILTHSSGIQPVPPKRRASKLLFAPGSKFAYSPHGFDFLQRAAERATAQPIGELVASTVLNPLKMTSSVFSWQMTPDTRAVGYDANDAPGQTINERVGRMSSEQRTAMAAEYPLMNFPNAASSLITTASDYATFLAAVNRPAPEGLLSERFCVQLREARIAAGNGIDWGLAFGLVHSRRQGIGLWHWGDFGLFQNFAIHFPDADRSLVSLTNGSRGQRFNRAIVKLLMAEDLDCFKWLRV